MTADKFARTYFTSTYVCGLKDFWEARTCVRVSTIKTRLYRALTHRAQRCVCFRLRVYAPNNLSSMQTPRYYTAGLCAHVCNLLLFIVSVCGFHNLSHCLWFAHICVRHNNLWLGPAHKCWRRVRSPSIAHTHVHECVSNDKRPVYPTFWVHTTTPIARVCVCVRVCTKQHRANRLDVVVMRAATHPPPTPIQSTQPVERRRRVARTAEHLVGGRLVICAQCDEYG